ncbi:MAG: formate dehydrogenase accessory sulfurtransferase FdhD [Phycisphaerales bacterium]|nr:MAG: formate dehydrogenase accessory sulfurtransferase FdhD [Phycisphaerales bacterium]
MQSDDDMLSHPSDGEEAADIAQPTCRVEPLRFSVKGGPPARDRCDVVVESVLTIMIEDIGSLTVLCTPNDTLALAVGFLFAEGIITGPEEITRLTQRADPLVVAVRVDNPEQVVAGRNLIVTSSCGMCGSRNIDKLIEGLKPGRDTFRVSPRVLRDVAREMRKQQSLFSRTGGTHAAAVFTRDGDIIAMGEDIGRHNALDKAVGKCLLEGRPLQERGVMLSGRISLEMIAKAARAGFEMAAGVSAPSSLAIEAAQRSNITLCGYVRADRATAYTHPHRIQNVGQLPD